MTATPHYGQQISPRVEDPSQRARQLTSARRLKVVAVLLTVAFLGLLGFLAYQGWPLDGNDWSSLITGSVCGLLAFFVAPWVTAVKRQRRAAEVFFLNGSHLTVSGKTGSGALDLSRTRAEVRLDWLVDSDLINSGVLTEQQRDTRIDLLHKAVDRQIASGRTPCVYVPVLTLYRQDGVKVPILLADNKSRRMRHAGEIHMLERAMWFAADPAIQHAAGQLRTVARWQRLPAIYAAQPHAIPAIPADYPATAAPPPTPVLRGENTPELTVIGPGEA